MTWKRLTSFLAFSSLSPLVSYSFEPQHVLGDHSSPSYPFNGDFVKLVNETLELWNVPGLAIGVVDGEDVFAEGYGIAQFPDIPVTPSTLFYAGSTTKAFVSAAMSLLVDDNEKHPNLNWTTPVSSLIRDDFVLQDEYVTNHVTIEDILSHRTGMGAYTMSYGGTHNGHREMPRDVVRSLRHLPLTAELRTTFQYCNLMFVVASHIIETLERVWLGDFLRERIWEPLGMKSTYFSNEDAIKAPEFLAQGYVYNNKSYQPVPLMNLDTVSGAGSIASNVLDYTKWIKAMINRSGPISAAGHEALRTSRIIESNGEPPLFPGVTTYTLGWGRGVYGGEEFYSHTGGMEAFVTNLVFFPRLKYGLIAFANIANGAIWAEKTLFYHLIDEKLGIPKSERANWTEVGRENEETIKKEYKTAVQRFFPTIPDPPIPLSLPLDAYTGTYYHPAFHNFSIEVRNGALYADRSNAAWRVKFEFEHISGEYFITRFDSLAAPGFSGFLTILPAEFVIGSDGKVGKVGLEMEAKIWFEKV